MITSAFLVFGFLAAALFMSLPANIVLPLRSYEKVKLGFNITASEMFPFFTKNPESDWVTPYRYDPETSTLQDLLLTPQGRPQNLLGLERSQRAQGPELAFILQDSRITWTPCTGAPARCVPSMVSVTATPVANRSPIPTVCGDIFLADEVPVPWAYRHLVDYSRRVVKIAHLAVSCRRS